MQYWFWYVAIALQCISKPDMLCIFKILQCFIFCFFSGNASF